MATSASPICCMRSPTWTRTPSLAPPVGVFSIPPIGLRADLEYLAPPGAKPHRRLHVAAWHTFEPDPGRTPGSAISLTFATAMPSWFTPGSSYPTSAKRFWLDHPAWREKPLCSRTPTWTGASHEPRQSRLLPRRLQGRRRAARPLRLGRREPGRTVLRIARGRLQPAASPR